MTVQEHSSTLTRVVASGTPPNGAAALPLRAFLYVLHGRTPFQLIPTNYNLQALISFCSAASKNLSKSYAFFLSNNFRNKY